MPSFRFLPHTADIAVELTAVDPAGLHRAGIDALRTLLVGASEAAAREERVIAPRGSDPTERLIHFLQDALYLFDVERFVPAEATAQGVAGELFDSGRHQPGPEVKAVTFHGAEVRPEADGLLHVTIVFDV